MTRLVSAQIGMIRIQQMRSRAEKAQGKEFDLGAFHDMVLEGGAIPLPVLDRVVNDWIAEN